MSVAYERNSYQQPGTPDDMPSSRSPSSTVQASKIVTCIVIASSVVTYGPKLFREGGETEKSKRAYLPKVPWNVDADLTGTDTYNHNYW